MLLNLASLRTATVRTKPVSNQSSLKASQRRGDYNDPPATQQQAVQRVLPIHLSPPNQRNAHYADRAARRA